MLFFTLYTALYLSVYEIVESKEVKKIVRNLPKDIDISWMVNLKPIINLKVVRRKFSSDIPCTDTYSKRKIYNRIQIYERLVRNNNK
jgi:hypothetical protein